MSYLRKSCPTNGWSRPGAGRRGCEPEVRKSYGGATNGPEWMIEDSKQCMSPGGVALLDSVDKVDWLMTDQGMNCLDVLERRMGATTAGLSRLHELLEYMISKAQNVAEEVASQTRQLSQRLIRNHMETYSALSTLRSLSLETVEPLHPPSLNKQPPSTPLSPDSTVIPSTRYDNTMEWLNASETGTVVHQDDVAAVCRIEPTEELREMLEGFLETDGLKSSKAVTQAKSLLEALETPSEDDDDLDWETPSSEGRTRVLTPRSSLRQKRSDTIPVSVPSCAVAGVIGIFLSAVNGKRPIMPHPPVGVSSHTGVLCLAATTAAVSVTNRLMLEEPPDDYPASREGSPMPSPSMKKHQRNKRRPSLPAVAQEPAPIPSRPSRNRLKPIANSAPLSAALSTTARTKRRIVGARPTSPSTEG
eukprot:TRINITY_DN3841_c0_g1_i1.p1 TRINITY_DN3841_c0_g1~~TRINITY_DN3841_c0_g1_i1.p1  ORF type:complete len:446 (+),score=41.95 TRINITY_DN3841_c0_g1_i1:85-1338(+)